MAAVLLVVALLAPWLAPRALRADNTVGSAECRHLTSQIDFYETRRERAEELGNEIWEDRIGAHLENLEDRREKRCPGHGDGDAAMEAFAELLRLAGKGALTFFTMGAF